MKNRRIAIVGFMGCGKTTIAEALAQRLSCEMVDLDSFIHDQDGRSAADIIKQDGEPSFRDKETKALQQILEMNKARVIALGGGTWTVAANRELIARHEVWSAWLNTPFELCWNRISSGAVQRPLAPNKETASDLYDSRRPSYQLATATINADESVSPQSVVALIISALSQT